MNEKLIFGMYAITIVAILQGVAWYVGFNGQMFALTALVIGGVIGSIFGFSIKPKPTEQPQSKKTE